MKVVISTILALGLAACNPPQLVPFDPVPPRAGLMVPPEKLPPLPEGGDLYDDATRARAAYGREADKVRGLQGYIRTLLKRARQKAEAKKK